MSVIDENQKLKQAEHNLFASLQGKEFEEMQNNKQVDAEGKINEKFGSQLKKLRELNVALDKVVKTFDVDAEVSIL